MLKKKSPWKTALSLISCTLVAFAWVYCARVADHQRVQKHLIETSLTWARQIALQAEGLTLTAREKGESDPIAWAVAVLTQGVEPRMIRVSQTEKAAGDVQNESYRLEVGSDIFDYRKTFTPENGRGIRIQINVGFTGFLGTHTQLENDLAQAFMFVLLWAVFWLIATRKIKPQPAIQVAKAVLNWVSEIRKLLAQAGVHLRATVVDAQRILETSKKTSETMLEIQQALELSKPTAHESSLAIRDTQQALLRTEQAALKLLAEGTRFGPAARPVVEMAGQIHRLILETRQASQRCENGLGRLEGSLEYLVKTAGAAAASYEQVLGNTQAMNGSVKKTTATLLSQAKMIQEINQEFGDSETIQRRRLASTK